MEKFEFNAFSKNMFFFKLQKKNKKKKNKKTKQT